MKCLNLVVFSKHLSQKGIFKGYSCLYKPTKNHINWKLGISKGFKTIFTIFVLEQGVWYKEQELRKN